MVYDELRTIARAVIRGRARSAVTWRDGSCSRGRASPSAVAGRRARLRASVRPGRSAALYDRGSDRRARARKAARRGGGWQRLTLDDVLDDALGVQDSGSGDLDEALARLESHDEKLARLVYLRYFHGFTNREIADDLEVSLSTVEAGLRLARAWLKRELDGFHPVDGSVCAKVSPCRVRTPGWRPARRLTRSGN